MQCGQDVYTIVVYAEPRQTRIRFRTIVKAVSAGGIITGSNTRPSYRQAQTSGAEQILKQGLPGFRVQTIEEIARRIREGCAESKDFLVTSSAIDADSSLGICGRISPLRRLYLFGASVL